MTRRGGERLGFLNQPASFGHKIRQWQRPQSYTSPSCKSLLVVTQHGKKIWEVVAIGGHGDWRPEAAGSGVSPVLLLAEHLSKTTPTHMCCRQVECEFFALCITPSARQPLCWIQWITAHLSQIWHELTHLATGTQKNTVPGVWKISLLIFAPSEVKSLAEKPTKFGLMLIWDRKIISTSGMSVSVLVWPDTS